MVRGCRCATSWCDLDLTIDLAVVTLTSKILSGQYFGNRKVGILVRRCRCATSWSDLDLTFDRVVVTLTYKIFSGLYLGNCKA